ncbi:MAG: hypothetical protein U1E83_09200 [Methylotetracoccus sp.]
MCAAGNFDYDQEHLVFDDAVTRNFHFIEREYGYRLSHKAVFGNCKIIRYESLDIYITFAYGPPTYEVEVSFGRIGIDDQADAYSFCPGDLILLEACENWAWRSENLDPLNGFITELARLFKECGSSCLRGDPTVFDQMKQRRDLSVEVWRKREHENDIRVRAEKAWANKDYAAVARLYGEIVDSLTPAEERKLQYSRKRNLR